MSKSLFFKTPFTSRHAVSLSFSLPSLTLQHCQDECDINHIMVRWQKTGIIEHTNTYEGKYGDFIHADDYQSSMNKVIAANDAFNSLPSSVRDKFSNDPVKFLDFVQNPKNVDAMREMGLLKPVQAEIKIDQPSADNKTNEP